MFRQIIPAFRIMLVLSLLTGLAYPGAVTVLSRWLFPSRADGSLVRRDGRIVGSTLIGQEFTRPGYFHSRPSAAGSGGYDASASSGTNLGPTSRKLIDQVQGSVDRFRAGNGITTGPVPADIVTSSGSGLDPHVSPASALAQVARVARARQADASAIRQLVSRMTEDRDLGFLGEPRVNVLSLNLSLDREFPMPK
jgi:potassium-transporting ATPase KdpC subunit